MNEGVYIGKVQVYLMQELPNPYNKLITVNNDNIVLVLPESIPFGDGYALLFKLIEASVERIRNREYDLNFTIWTRNQTRDFKIYR